VTFKDADEVQSLIQHHAQCIVEAIADGGIVPSKQPVLVKTCERMVELAKHLADFPVS